MADDKRLEFEKKYLKKLRPFFDDKQKPKQRIAVLQGFIESSTENEQRRFFIEYHDQIFRVINEAFQRIIEKIKAAKDKNERSLSITSKEVLELFKLLGILRRGIGYLPEQMKSGVYSADIETILRYLLCNGNHHRIRVEGFRVLLLWMAQLGTQVPSCLDLFANTIMLHVFDSFALPTSMEASTSFSNLNEVSPTSVSKDDAVKNVDDAAPRSHQKTIETLDLPYIVNATTSPTQSEMIELFDEFIAFLNMTAESESSNKSLIGLLNERISPSDTPANSSGEQIDDDSWRPFVPESKRSDATSFLWDMFKKYYIKYLFSDLARKLGYDVPFQTGFVTCPPPIINMLIQFITDTCCNEIDGPAIIAPEQDIENLLSDEATMPGNIAGIGTSASAGAASTSRSDTNSSKIMLKSILLGSEENRQLIHEIIRYAMLLPYSHSATITASIHILKNWIMCSRHQAPSFLHYTDDLKPIDPANIRFDATINMHLRRYIWFVRLVFLKRAAENTDVTSAQIETFKEGLQFFLAIIEVKHYVIDEDTWETFMTCLLHIHADTTCPTFDKSIFQNPFAASDITGDLVEVLLLTWIRSGTTKADFWRKLQDQLSESTHWIQTIEKWLKILVKLTRILGKHAYGVDLESIKTESESKRSRMQSSPMKSLLATYGSNPPATTTPESPTSFKTDSLPKSSARGEFGFSMEWNSERCLFVWKNMVCVLGNVNAIADPNNHTEAIQGLVNIWEMLAQIRAHQPFHAPSMPFLFEFAPWLFQAASLPKPFENSVVLAYACICRMMCRRHDQPFKEEYYSHFYRLVAKGFLRGNDRITFAIINNCTGLFTLGLPGCHILVPTFIKVISKMFTSTTLPSTVRKNAITILSSLLVTTSHYADLKLPVFTVDTATEGTYPLEVSEEMTFNQAKVHLINTLLEVISEEKNTEEYCGSETHCMLLYSFVVLAFEEIVSRERPDGGVIDECINCLLSHLYLSDLNVIHAVGDCLNLISQNIARLAYIDNASMRQIIEKITQAIGEHIHDNAQFQQSKGFIIARLLFCLQEWVVNMPAELMVDAKLGNMIFGTVEAALALADTDQNRQEAQQQQHGEDGNIGALPSGPRVGVAVRQRSFSDLPASLGKSTRRMSGNKEDMANVRAGMVGDLDKLEQSPEQGLLLVKEAAQSVLNHIVSQVAHFPTPFGVSTLSTSVLEPHLQEDHHAQDDDRCLFFTFHNTIISVIELPGANPRMTGTRFILRNMTGRYAWDSYIFYEDLRKALSIIEKAPARFSEVLSTNYIGVAEFLECLSLGNSMGSEELTTRLSGMRLGPGSLMYTREEDCLPVWKANVGIERHDMLSELLSYIEARHQDCLLASNKSLNLPGDIPQIMADNLSASLLSLAHHIQAEKETARLFEKDCQELSSSTHDLHQRDIDSTVIGRLRSNPSGSYDTNGTRSYTYVKPSKYSSVTPLYQKSRLLLSHIGFMNFDGTKNGTFHMLTKSPSLYRDIKGLDKRNSRETVKVAIIYVGSGQEDEQGIFRNDRGSFEYDEFVGTLGWEIDIPSHLGYLGGLERNAITGHRATYFCTSTIEVIFHDVTKFPNDPDDPKYLKKKRHIGNDHVHIVWNEHERDYRRDTIKGDFGNALIVVTPLVNGLFAVDIHGDSKLPNFGPLQNKMIVSKSALGPLVRATAISAYHAAMQSVNKTSLYRHAFTQRLKDIETIASRHKAGKWTYEKFLENVLMTSENTVVNTAGVKDSAINPNSLMSPNPLAGQPSASLASFTSSNSSNSGGGNNSGGNTAVVPTVTESASKPTSTTTAGSPASGPDILIDLAP